MYGRQKVINPLLGVYYGIFAAGYIGLGLLLLIFEYMQVINGHITYAMTLVAFVLACGIAFAATTRSSDEFFASGRRVPAGLNGLVILMVSVGGAGLSGLVGSAYFLGIDSYALLLGLLAGVMLAGILMAGFVRKSGAYTISSFFEIRYASRMAGVISALCLLLPTAALALAELALVKQLGPFVLGLSAEMSMLVIAGGALLLVLPGGVRSMSWSQCALAIVLLLGLIVPLVIISLQYTNLPLAQMTYGSLIEDLAKFEAVGGEPLADQGDHWRNLLGGEAQLSALSFSGGVRAFGPVETLTLFFVMAAGIAGMPALLMRASVTASVFEARKSFAWGTALVGLLILTIPAYVVFMRYMLFDPQAKILLSSLPSWASDLQSIGLFAGEDVDSNGQLSPREMLLGRDGVFVGLPMVADLNKTLQSVTFAALLAAAFGGLTARIMTLAQLFIRDLNPQKAALEADVVGTKSLIWARLVVVLVGAVLLIAALQMEIDAFRLFMVAVLLSAMIFFPALLLSIWWRGMTVTGLLLLFSVGTTLGIGLLVITNMGAEAGPFGLDLMVLAPFGLIASLLIGIIGSVIGPKPTGRDLEMLSEIRTPGGEAVYDRMLRLAMPRRGAGK